MKSIISLVAGVALLSSGFAFAEPVAKPEFELVKDKNFAAGSDQAAEYFTEGNVITDILAGSFGLATMVGVLLWAGSANGTPETGGTAGTTGTSGTSGTTSSY